MIGDYVFDGWARKFKASIVDRHIGDFRHWEEPDRFANAFDRLRRTLDAARGRPG
jgi:hypothetical protein